MADNTSSLKTPAEIDREAINRYNRLLEESINREKKLRQHWLWRGNKLPPMSIEPMAHERQRLSTPMTAEDRAARKQWLQDQKLSPNEPRHIPELYPKNPIRRLLAAPWNMVTSALKPVVGQNMATSFRFYAPKAAIGFVLACGAWYHLKYHPQDWTHDQGWHIYQNRPPIYPGDPRWPHPEEKAHDDFYDKGFKAQTALTR